MFKTVHGRNRGFQERAAICAPKLRRASLSTLRTSSAPPAASCPSASARSARAFRNEITPGNFTFRTREFEQMELRVLLQARHRSGVVRLLEGLLQATGCCRLGIKEENLRLRDHEQAELSFYSKRHHRHRVCLFPFADWGELWGIADRTNYDLSRHQEAIRARASSTSTPRPTSTISPMSVEPSLGC